MVLPTRNIRTEMLEKVLVYLNHGKVVQIRSWWGWCQNVGQNGNLGIQGPNRTIPLTALNILISLRSKRFGKAFRTFDKQKMPRTCGKPYGNACYAGYILIAFLTELITEVLPSVTSGLLADMARDLAGVDKQFTI